MNVTRRSFLKTASWGAAGMVGMPSVFAAAASGREEKTPVKDWLRQRGRIYWYDQYALNEQDTAFARYDPDRIVEELTRTGADIVVVYAANQFSIAYYPSKILPQHPNLGGRDYVGDLVSRLRACGKKIVCYINWLESRHPEWYTVPLGSDPTASRAEQPLANWADPSDPDKRVQRLRGGDWRFPCINSPRREQVKAVAREIVERYQPDAFHLDMYHANAALCVCNYCRPSIERICGTANLSRDVIDANWNEFIDWRCDRSASLIAELTATLREHGVLAVHNAGVPLLQSSLFGLGEEWMPHLDVYVSEIFSNLEVPGLMVRLQRALGLPSWELLTSAAPQYAHLSIPVAWWRLSAAVCKANGGEVLGPCGVGAFPDTTTSPELLKNVKTGLDFFMQDADLFEGATSAAKVALVFSWATRKYHRRGAMNWSEEIDGWARLLQDEHLPFDFVVAEKVSSAESFTPYDLIILPNTACLSDSFCACLAEYVRNGGIALASGETGLFTEKGTARKDFALGDVFGISYKDSAEGDFAIDQEGGPAPASGIFQRVFTTGDVLARQFAVDPAGSVAGAKDPLPVGPTEWPVAVLHRYEKGQSLYIAFDVGRFYAKHRLKHVADLMADLIGDVLPARPILAKAPRSVEVTVWAQSDPNRTIIHLADHTQSSTDLGQISEIIRIADIEIFLDTPCQNPKVTCRNAEVQWSLEGETLRVHIPLLDAYAAIVIEPFT